jgi:hypothetical protein
MIVRKQPFLRVADVVRVIQKEVRNAGGQTFLARKVGLNRPNLNSTLSGRRPPTGDILRAFNLQKVFAYEREGRTRDQEPLRMEGVVRLLRDEVERAGSQAEWGASERGSCGKPQ